VLWPISALRPAPDIYDADRRDKAQHSAGSNLLHSVQLGDLPGIGMTIIDGIVRTQRSRNTPPATKVPVIVGH
jgi:enamidase